jgi:hypothetical protein
MMKIVRTYGKPLCSLLAMLAGCSAGDGPVQGSNAALFSLPEPESVLWPVHDIPVCWNQDTWDSGEFQELMWRGRAAVEDTYGRVTDLRFPGWKRCPDTAAGTIRIRLFHGLAGSTDGGYRAGTFTDMDAGDDDVGQVAVSVFLHEFAHALGFDHEIDRLVDPAAGAPPENMRCKVPASTRAGREFTPYDDESILNATYCSYRVTLSPWDVVGLQRVYGSKPTLTLVGAGNKCLDVESPGGAAPTATTRVQAWDCLGNENQVWRYGTDKRFSGVGPFAFLDVQYASSNDFTPVWNWTDNPGPAQFWSMPDVQVVGMGDLCLQVPGNAWSAGQPLELGTCQDADPAQRWAIATNGDRFWIRGAAQNFCVTLDGAGRALLGICGTTQAESDFMLHERHVVGLHNGCLAVQNADPRPGTSAAAVSCDWQSEAWAQHWKIRGAIRGLADKCLEFGANDAFNNRSPAQINTCFGTKQQSWEYHF